MFTVPEDIYAKVAPVARAEGVPDYVWASIAHMETGGTFNSRALGDGGKSYGLFQLYTNGGQGDPYKSNPTVLFDPALNAQVAMPRIADAYKSAKNQGMDDGPELAAWVAGHSGHPGYRGASNSIAAAAMEAVRKAASKLLGTGSGMGDLKQAEADQANKPGNNSLFERIKAFFQDPRTAVENPDAVKLFGERLVLISLGGLFIVLAIFLVADLRGSEA